MTREHLRTDMLLWQICDMKVPMLDIHLGFKPQTLRHVVPPSLMYQSFNSHTDLALVAELSGYALLLTTLSPAHTIKGPLTGWGGGGPQCRMSNLRNGYVNCHYFSNFHVDFKMLSCRMSNLRNGLCHVDNIFLSSR